MTEPNWFRACNRLKSHLFLIALPDHFDASGVRRDGTQIERWLVLSILSLTKIKVSADAWPRSAPLLTESVGASPESGKATGSAPIRLHPAWPCPRISRKHRGMSRTSPKWPAFCVCTAITLAQFVIALPSRGDSGSRRSRLSRHRLSYRGKMHGKPGPDAPEVAVEGLSF